MRFGNVEKSYVARFLRSLSFFGAVTVPYMLDWLQVDYTRIFLLQAWFCLWIVIFEVPTGVFADKVGRKVSLMLGTMLFIVDLVIFGTTRDYMILYVAEFFGALGIALYSGVDKSLIYDSLLEEGRAGEGRKCFSNYEAAGTLAVVISFPLGSYLAGSGLIAYPMSLAFMFLLSALTIALSMGLILSMKEPERRKPVESGLKMSIIGLTAIMKDSRLRRFALNSVLISSLTFFMFWFYQPLTEMAGYDVRWFGIVGASYNLVAAGLLLNVHRIEKLFGMKRLLECTAVLPGLFFLGLAFTGNGAFIIASIFVIAVSKILRAPILADYMNQHIESDLRATVLSSVSLMERLIIFILYPIVGMLADANLRIAFVMLGLLILISAALARIDHMYL
ncbi:MAG: MFS transporter [Candidatus Altiarchaeales archaeon]|nr:MFS transporter [Candidatus Altiarchaeales archaeon]MBD3416109.1 MFS transporter [Candidatus Altiarchaeales archaeon]